jgi:hypothetical protein
MVLAGCSGSSGGSPSSSGPAPSTSSQGPGKQPAPKVSPLTGEKASNNPVIAVKIEDTALGRPQAGTNKADIVYIEQVEGGLTRLMAIFNSSLPTVVEPVRSTRPSDPELALQYGNLIFVTSGGSKAGLAPLLKTHIKAVIGDRGGVGLTRDPNRQAPENLMANLPLIAKKVKGPKAHSIGLTWSKSTPAGKTSKGTLVQTRVGNTPVEFKYNTKSHRYMRVIDGAIQHTKSGSVISTPNVVVQFCKITVYTKDRDVNGNPAQYTKTVGSGRAVVYRNGRRIDGTWRRKSVSDGTLLRTKSGKPIPLNPGGAWFVLVNQNTPFK